MGARLLIPFTSQGPEHITWPVSDAEGVVKCNPQLGGCSQPQLYALGKNLNLWWTANGLYQRWPVPVASLIPFPTGALPAHFSMAIHTSLLFLADMGPAYLWDRSSLSFRRKFIKRNVKFLNVKNCLDQLLFPLLSAIPTNHKETDRRTDKKQSHTSLYNKKDNDNGCFYMVFITILFLSDSLYRRPFNNTIYHLRKSQFKSNKSQPTI